MGLSGTDTGTCGVVSVASKCPPECGAAEQAGGPPSALFLPQEGRPQVRGAGGPRGNRWNAGAWEPVTSDPAGLHRGVGTGLASSSHVFRGPWRERSWDLVGGCTLLPVSPAWCWTPGSVQVGSCLAPTFWPARDACSPSPLSCAHLLPARRASWEPWCQEGPQSPCLLLGSARRPPPLPPKPSNGWVMRAGGAGEGQGGRCHRLWHGGLLIRFANAICHRASIWGSR